MQTSLFCIRMQKLVIACALLLISNAGWCEELGLSQGEGAFKKIVSYLATKEEKTLTRFGNDELKVTCTFLPQGRILAIGWDISNPHEKSITIEPGDIRVRDHVRQFDTLKPEKAARTIFAGEFHEQPTDPFIDEEAPEAYVVPGLQAFSDNENAIYASSFPFGSTNAARVTGLTYYPRYGSLAYVKCEIKIDGETYAFEFE